MVKFELRIIADTQEEIQRYLSTTSVGTLTTLAGNMGTQFAGSIQPTGPVTVSTINGTDEGDNEPVNMNAPAVDTTGMPWDGRIHSDNKGTTKDGAWRKRRNLDPNVAAAVEAELRQRAGMGQATMTMQQPLTPMPNAQPPMMQPMQPQPMHPQMHQQPVQQYQPTHQPQPMQQPQQQPMPMQQQYQPQPVQQYQPVQQPQPMQSVDFQTFMNVLTQRMALKMPDGSPMMDVNYLTSVVQRVNGAFGKQYNVITDINADQQAIDYAVACMLHDGRWQ